MRMPDDQLFSYDSADLQLSAMVQLQKLGTLIKRNPKATFTVEGYTDSLGSFEYNLDLSQRRADSVKQYLVEAMGNKSGANQRARVWGREVHCGAASGRSGVWQPGRADGDRAAASRIAASSSSCTRTRADCSVPVMSDGEGPSNRRYGGALTSS